MAVSPKKMPSGASSNLGDRGRGRRFRLTAMYDHENVTATLNFRGNVSRMQWFETPKGLVLLIGALAILFALLARLLG